MGVISHPKRSLGKLARQSVISQGPIRRTVKQPKQVETQESIDRAEIAAKMSPYMKRAEKPEKDESDDDSESRQADIRRKIGIRRIEVQSIPSEARVYVDDVKMGITPLFIEVLDDEVASVRVSLKGHRSTTIKTGTETGNPLWFILDRY